MILTPSAPGLAQPSVRELVSRLAQHSDFRVRTQAALALGASKSQAAVSPLCSALEDGNATVRAAAAAALGRLSLGGTECLESRLEDETSRSVKSVIAKAIERMKEGLGPALTSETKYYVAIGPTTDQTGRSAGEVHARVRKAMMQAMVGVSGYAVAPDGESVDQAKKVMAEHSQLKAFFLWPKVKSPEYSGGNLTIRLEISIFTYPGKAMKGMIPLKLTMPDVQRGDTDSENTLIDMAASKAFEKFTENVSRLE